MDWETSGDCCGDACLSYGLTRKNTFDTLMEDREYIEWEADVENFLGIPWKADSEDAGAPLPKKSVVFDYEELPRDRQAKYCSALHLTQMYLSSVWVANEVHDMFLAHFSPIMMSFLTELLVGPTTAKEICATRACLLRKLWLGWCGNITQRPVDDPTEDTFYDEYPFAVRSTSVVCTEEAFANDMILVRDCILEQRLTESMAVMRFFSDPLCAKNTKLMFGLIIQPEKHDAALVEVTAKDVALYFIFIIFASIITLERSMGIDWRTKNTMLNRSSSGRVMRYLHQTLRNTRHLAEKTIREVHESGGHNRYQYHVESTQVTHAYSKNLKEFVNKIGPMLACNISY